MQSKSFLHSRTIIFNAIIAGLAVIEANAHLLRDELSNTQFIALLAGVAIANMLLRSVTTKPVHLKKGDDDA